VTTLAKYIITFGALFAVAVWLAGNPFEFTQRLPSAFVKNMVAITSLAEGLTCLASVVMWFALLTTGVVIDYMLLPSFVIGTILAAVAAPYTTRVLPERFWKFAVPVYCCLLAAYSFYKIWPDIQKRLLS
jgi:hypothetical protein